MGSIPIARFIFRCLACPCVVLKIPRSLHWKQPVITAHVIVASTAVDKLQATGLRRDPSLHTRRHQ